MKITTVPPSAACGRRIGVIAAITRQIGRMRPTYGRRIAADYERRNAFLVFITNAAARRPRVGRMRSIWRVIAAITPMRRPHAAAGGTVVILIQ